MGSKVVGNLCGDWLRRWRVGYDCYAGLLGAGRLDDRSGSSRLLKTAARKRARR